MADPDLDGVQAQLDPLGPGMGEHVRQCLQTQTGPVGDRAAPLGHEGAYLPDDSGDGGAVDTEQQPQH
ncbi:hypothetical protein GCM10010406_34900 [Streptomyces thermolineatus]|uniref:Uncharacterized protein n=1 Tax=Streptomyces thermolineatus TaxID=44033 RepID=A0ABP5ZG54_9ACTN